MKKAEQKKNEKRLQLAEDLAGQSIKVNSTWLKNYDNLLYDILRNDQEVLKDGDIIKIEFKPTKTNYYIVDGDTINYVGSDIYQDYEINTLKTYKKKINQIKKLK